MNIIKDMPWIYWIDDIGHRMHLPKKLQHPLCERLDKAFGVAEEKAADDAEWEAIYTSYDWEITNEEK